MVVVFYRPLGPLTSPFPRMAEASWKSLGQAVGLVLAYKGERKRWEKQNSVSKVGKMA